MSARELSLTGEQKLQLPQSPHVGVVHVTVVKADGEQDPLRELLAASKNGRADEFLEPLYDTDKLIQLYEKAAMLQPNIDAIATNVDLHGHTFVPVIQLDAPNVEEHVRVALLADRMLADDGKARGSPADNDRSIRDELREFAEFIVPDDTEVTETIGLLRRLALVELNQLQSFFSYACAESSFPQLRAETRTDVEATGNGYWEVLRDQRGRLARFSKIATSTIRMTARDETPVLVNERVRVADLTWRTVPQLRYFRKYAQFDSVAIPAIVGLRKPRVWFKEFGDPRTVSQKTGKVYADTAAMQQVEGQSTKAATEILHFKIYTPASAYGSPRYSGNLPNVLGTRQNDEVNEAYFDNKAVPPLALLVSGGRLAKGVINRIGDIFESTKGLKNFHRIVAIEAEPAPSASSPSAPTGPNSVPKISIEPLRDAQQDDALFQQYDRRNQEKIDASFRVPAALKGAKPDLAATRSTEAQVFAPMRNDFDDLMNRRILPELGIRFWKFKSSGPSLQDHEAMGRLLVDLTNAAAIRPVEARELAGPLLQRHLAPIDEEWANRPLALTLAMVRAMSGPAEAVRVQTDSEHSAEAVRSAVVEGAPGLGPGPRPSVGRESEEEDEDEDEDEDEAAVEVGAQAVKACGKKPAGSSAQQPRRSRRERRGRPRPGGRSRDEDE